MLKFIIALCFSSSLFLSACQQRTSPQKISGLTQSSANDQLGESVFAKLVKNWNGKVPTPFPALIYEVRDSYNATLHSQLFPKGRSLQRELSDFANPRVLVSYSDSKSSHHAINEVIDNRLFISYVKNGDQLEVISYNDQEGQFDFFTVDSYVGGAAAGRTQKIFKEDRFTCTVCHQNGGPIFTEEDWSESNSGDETISKLAKVHNIKEHDLGTLYEGVPIISTFGKSNVFDETTDIGNGFLGIQTFWKQACPQQGSMRDRCRRLMLALGIEASWNSHTRIFAPIDSQSAYWKELWFIWQKSWPKDGIQFHLSHLNEFMFNPATLNIPAYAAPEADRAPLTIMADKPYHYLFRSSYLREEDIVYKPNIYFGWFRFFLVNPDIERIKTKYQTLAKVQHFVLNDPGISSLVESDVLSRRWILERLE